MLKLYVWLKGLIKSERGQDMVEYALITLLISIAIVIAAITIIDPAFTAWATDVCAKVTPGGVCL
jgi:Flp pilus assembly pilin Flp